jgi:hypothetical protein
MIEKLLGTSMKKLEKNLKKQKITLKQNNYFSSTWLPLLDSLRNQENKKKLNYSLEETNGIVESFARFLVGSETFGKCI